jgi:tetratricopeptide (TPR) repeat protein
MNKKLFFSTILLLIGTLSAYSVDVKDLPKIQPDGSVRGDNAYQQSQNNYEPDNEQEENDNSGKIVFDKYTMYYPNANIKSSIAKYKSGNYSGCLQELFSLVRKDPSNSLAYYYMAMAYTHLGMKADAINAYEKVLSLNPNDYLAEYAIKGRDCLTGGPACHPQVEEEELDDLDKFVRSPYGNGLSETLNNEVKQNQLKNIKETINNKERLEQRDIQKTRDFDQKNSKSSIEENDKIAQVSDEELLGAIKTLKDAGVNITIQPENPYMTQYQDPQLAELSMMLGSNNNNNNSMMNMMPMLMAQSQQGKNIDPRLMQAMLMNSMISDISFTNNNNDR